MIHVRFENHQQKTTANTNSRELLLQLMLIAWHTFNFRYIFLISRSFLPYNTLLWTVNVKFQFCTRSNTEIRNYFMELRQNEQQIN